MEFRVGINSGEVLITRINDLHGDAINVAARVQSLSPPGGILVTGVVYDQLRGRNDVGFEYLGTHQLKNLSRQIRIYRLNFSHSADESTRMREGSRSPTEKTNRGPVDEEQQ